MAELPARNQNFDKTQDTESKDAQYANWEYLMQYQAERFRC